MNGVATEIAEKIGVFFEDQNFDSGTGQEKTKNHACGAPADDTTAGFYCLRWTAFNWHCEPLGQFDAWRLKDSTGRSQKVSTKGMLMRWIIFGWAGVISIPRDTTF